MTQMQGMMEMMRGMMGGMVSGGGMDPGGGTAPGGGARPGARGPQGMQQEMSRMMQQMADMHKHMSGIMGAPPAKP